MSCEGLRQVLPAASSYGCLSLDFLRTLPELMRLFSGRFRGRRSIAVVIVP